MNIKGILASLEQLLAYPNPDDPLIAEIADEYRNDYPTYVKKAREFTQLHAVNITFFSPNANDGQFSGFVQNC